MSAGYRREGLLRGIPPYPWWQWVLVGALWAASMFLVFALIAGFRHLVDIALICLPAGVLWAVLTRTLIARRTRIAAEAHAAESDHQPQHAAVKKPHNPLKLPAMILGVVLGIVMVAIGLATGGWPLALMGGLGVLCCAIVLIEVVRDRNPS